MKRILVLLLGLAAVAWAVKFALEGTTGRNPGPTMQKQQLDNVRESAREIERQEQRHLDETLKKAGGANEP